MAVAPRKVGAKRKLKKRAASGADEPAAEASTEVPKDEKVEQATPEQSAPAAASTTAEAEAAPGKAARRKKSKANRLKLMQEAAEAEEEGQGDEGGGAAAAAAAEPAEPRAAIYVGHIPKGFAEPQMNTFLKQFGRITRLRMARSKKNGQSKGYAFVEFEEESVARIVADTLDKYLLFGRELKCKLIPREEQHPGLFRNWRKKMVNLSISRRKKDRTAHNDRPKVDVNGTAVPQTTTREAERRSRADKKRRGQLAAQGIDYDLDLPDVEDEEAGEKEVAAAAAEPAAPAKKQQQKKRRKGA